MQFDVVGDTLILSVKAGSKVPERLDGILATVPTPR